MSVNFERVHTDRRTLVVDDSDPLVRERFYEEAGQLFLAKTQDVEAVAEACKAEMARVDERARWGEGQKVASIPLVVLERRPELLYDDEAVRAWVNDPENAMFRTRPGRV